MKKTPLFDKHLEYNARMVPFGGYMMPIQYKKGIIHEHTATRTRATVFDTCHMGEFRINGSNAVADLERILSCTIATIKIGTCRYGYICNENGGIIDDQILYRIGENDFFMVVNASTTESDYKWIVSNCSNHTEVEDLSSQTAKIDIQGPMSPSLCSKLLDQPIRGLNYYQFMYTTYRGKKVLVSRTGYTGEIGFEVYISPEYAGSFWDECIKNGAEPAGLGARDTLRLEMCYPLYGHELDEKTNASWTGFSKALGDKEFIGSKAIHASSGSKYRLCALLLDGRRTAHNGDIVADTFGSSVGRITSGSFSPSIGRAIALGYVIAGCNEPGTSLRIKNDRGDLTASVVNPPFFKKATGHDNIETYLT